MPKPKKRWISRALAERKPGTVEEWLAEDHGVESSQYFQGCGTSFSRWDDVGVGIGNNAVEAYDDAVEQLASSGWDTFAMPERPRGLSSKSRLPGPEEFEDERAYEESELHHFVCVYVRGIPPTL